MIGVSVNSTDLQAAEEFFELFKTPWELAVAMRKYDAVLCANGRLDGLDANLFLVYGSGEVAADRDAAIEVEQGTGPVEVEWDCTTFPIYGRVARFDSEAVADTLKSGGKAVEYQHRSKGRLIRRIGYDLFGEVRYLLTDGQPASQALTPTLELHIALLRHLLAEADVPYVEIPPRPAGCDFICCLTHDVDFFGIRRHKFDRTLLGFLARASVGTLADFVRGRRSAVDVARNWVALLSLPLVFARLAPDFWTPFEDYARVEEGKQSTFFLVPFRGRPGTAPDGSVDGLRAAPYQISEIAEQVRGALGRESELAVHGIDAWRDADAGRAEMRELTALTGRRSAGVRMHWLYFAPDSPHRLEAAGFDYDSTWGYNEAVGYRAGTSQAFRPLGCERLMELPLSIMDSALFYPGRMGLDREEGMQRGRTVVSNARRYGGTLVINWHDRSLAPERLWDGSYRDLRKEVGNGDWVWFATAADAVDWFRWRRSIRFAQEESSGGVTIVASSPRVRARAATVQIFRGSAGSEAVVEERRFDGREPLRLQFGQHVRTECAQC
jgi:hypothetical protein